MRNNTLGIRGAWLTVNRFCNFRCLWCYAEDTEYKTKSELSFEQAIQLVNLIKAIGVMNITLIGGEPIFWKHLFPLTEYIDQSDLTSTLVTNGYMLSRKKYLKKVLHSPISAINISMKAWDKNSYQRLTKRDAFYDVTKAIAHLSKEKTNSEISITISSLTINNLLDMVNAAMDAGAKKITLSFCTTVFNNSKPTYGYMSNLPNTIAYILKNYHQLNQITMGNLAIEQSYPSCLWPLEFLRELENKKQIFYGCHLLRREGIIFGPEGEILPCNCLHDFSLGSYGRDFTCLESFTDFWNRKEVNFFYDQIITYPSPTCINCQEYNLCGGGCPLQWFIYQPKDTIKGVNPDKRSTHHERTQESHQKSHRSFKDS